MAYEQNKILIADDHPLLLRGLHDFLKSVGYHNILEVNDGLEAYNTILKEEPSLAILDIRMPKLSGIEVARKCRTNHVKTQIILITLHQEKELFDQAQKLGVAGYIFKQFTLVEIHDCIKEVLAGRRYFSPRLKQYFHFSKSNNPVLDQLTPSEKKILRLIAKNHTTPQIAKMLFIASKTVEKHRSNISKKLGLSGKTNSLLLWAKQHEDALDSGF